MSRRFHMLKRGKNADHPESRLTVDNQRFKGARWLLSPVELCLAKMLYNPPPVAEWLTAVKSFNEGSSLESHWEPIFRPKSQPKKRGLSTGLAGRVTSSV